MSKTKSAYSKKNITKLKVYIEAQEVKKKNDSQPGNTGDKNNSGKPSSN